MWLVQVGLWWVRRHSAFCSCLSVRPLCQRTPGGGGVGAPAVGALSEAESGGGPNAVAPEPSTGFCKWPQSLGSRGDPPVPLLLTLSSGFEREGSLPGARCVWGPGRPCSPLGPAPFLSRPDLSAGALLRRAAFRVDHQPSFSWFLPFSTRRPDRIVRLLDGPLCSYPRAASPTRGCDLSPQVLCAASRQGPQLLPLPCISALLPGFAPRLLGRVNQQCSCWHLLLCPNGASAPSCVLLFGPARQACWVVVFFPVRTLPPAALRPRRPCPGGPQVSALRDGVRLGRGRLSAGGAVEVCVDFCCVLLPGRRVRTASWLNTPRLRRASVNEDLRGHPP